jgi:hypothetical protein
LLGGEAFNEARNILNYLPLAQSVALLHQFQILSGIFDTKVSADFSAQVVVDFAMAWHRRPLVLRRIVPPRMTASFS